MPATLRRSPAKKASASKKLKKKSPLGKKKLVKKSPARKSPVKSSAHKKSPKRGGSPPGCTGFRSGDWWPAAADGSCPLGYGSPLMSIDKKLCCKKT